MKSLLRARLWASSVGFAYLSRPEQGNGGLPGQGLFKIWLDAAHNHPCILKDKLSICKDDFYSGLT
ncbi:MAG: hypothetical protein K9M97_08195 [Akkermansiaceae bacterium]|nr:hypothetical protein [Akkermansiaceae bacterium]